MRTRWVLEHTVAVATLALEACALHPRLNSDLLLCASIYDVGKTREFELGAEIALSEAGALVGHLALAGSWWRTAHVGWARSRRRS